MRDLPRVVNESIFGSTRQFSVEENLYQPMHRANQAHYPFVGWRIELILISISQRVTDSILQMSSARYDLFRLAGNTGCPVYISEQSGVHELS